MSEGATSRAGVLDMLRARRGVIALACSLGALGLVIVLAGGHGITDASPTALAVDTLIAVVHEWAVAGALPLGYVLGALGAGLWIARRLGLGQGPGSLAMAISLGLTAALSLTHVLAVSGVFAAGVLGMVAAWAGTAGGLLLLARELSRARSAGVRIPMSALWATPALGVLMVGACVPPGVLWATEFGGYDALSYHLQLPREWLALGRMGPADHNVYSFLPGYLEGAFYNIAVMSGADSSSFSGGVGRLLLSAQMTHALVGVLAALALASLCKQLLQGGDSDRAGSPAALAGAMFLATPWTVVAATLAYNEMAVIAMGAGAMALAARREAAPLFKGALCGLLVAGCCGAKMTSILLVAPPVGVLMLMTTGRRAWPMLSLACAAVGLVALAPWLIRNIVAGDNPVFPFLHALFGDGHWTPEQHARYAASHAFSGSVWDRLSLLFMPDAGASGLPGQHRGMLHPQWGIFFPCVLAGLVVGLTDNAGRRVAAALGVGLALQLGAWLFATHLQSRFLLPMVLTGLPLIAMGLAKPMRAAPWGSRVTSGMVVGVLLVAAQTGTLWWTWIHQARGRPAEMMFVGPAAFNGVARSQVIASAPEDQRDRVLLDATPAEFANLVLPRGATLYLVADAKALYYREPVRYNSTWDTWPIVEAIRTGGSPEDVTRRLRDDGVDFVLIDFGELDRLMESGYADPLLGGAAMRDWVTSLGRPLQAWTGATSAAIFDIRGATSPEVLRGD